MPAPLGNKYAQKYSEEDATELFIKGLEYAEQNNDCLSLHDAIKQTSIPYSTYDYLAEKHEVLGRIKKDTMIEVLRRINKGALKGDYQPTSSIWRMKQLGEKDENYNYNKVTEVPLTTEEIQQAKDKMEDEY